MTFRYQAKTLLEAMKSTYRSQVQRCMTLLVLQSWISPMCQLQHQQEDIFNDIQTNRIVLCLHLPSDISLKVNCSGMTQ